MQDIRLTDKEIDVLEAIGILYISKKDINPHSISNLKNMSWETAKKILIKLKEIKND